MNSLFPDFFQPAERILAALCQARDGSVEVQLSADVVEAYLADSSGSWGPFVAMAQAEQMGPMLLAAVQQNVPLAQAIVAAWGPLPKHLRQSLVAEQRRTWIAGTMRQSVLADLHRSFGEASLPYVTFKGMAYLQTLYQDPALRPMQDMDLVVSPERLEEAIALVEACGLARYDSSHPCAVLFRHPSGSMFLDLHFRISRPGMNFIEVADVLDSVDHVESMAKGTPHVPGDIEQFLLHVNHQCKGQLTSGRVALLSFLEAAALYQRVCGRWSEVVVLAERWKMRAFLDVGLWCLEALVPGVVVPGHLRRELLRHWLTRLVRQPCHPDELGHPRKVLERSVFLLSHIEGWGQRATYVRDRLRYPLKLLERLRHRMGAS